MRLRWPPDRIYPWRAFMRGFFLFITYTRPRRRTTRQFLSRVLADFKELRIFIGGSQVKMQCWRRYAAPSPPCQPALRAWPPGRRRHQTVIRFVQPSPVESPDNRVLRPESP